VKRDADGNRYFTMAFIEGHSHLFSEFGTFNSFAMRKQVSNKESMRYLKGDYSNYHLRQALFVKTNATLADPSNRRRLPNQYRKDAKTLREEYLRQVIPMKKVDKGWVTNPLIFSKWTGALVDEVQEEDAEIFTLDEYLEALFYSVAFQSLGGFVEGDYGADDGIIGPILVAHVNSPNALLNLHKNDSLNKS
jgi:hypothetical protein